MKKFTTSSSKFSKQYLLGVFICSVMIWLLFINAYSYATTTSEHSYVATVTEIKRTFEGSGYHYFVVTNLADSGETHIFQFRVSTLGRFFGSSDLSDSIETGKTYRFTVYGYNKTLYPKEYETIVLAEEIDVKKP